MVEYSDGYYNGNWLKFYFENGNFREAVKTQYLRKKKNEREKKQQLSAVQPIIEQSCESSFALSKSFSELSNSNSSAMKISYNSSFLRKKLNESASNSNLSFLARSIASF